VETPDFKKSEQSCLPEPELRIPDSHRQKPPKKKKKKWSVNDFQVEPAKGKTRFHDLGLPLNIMHAVADLDFRYCTPVQAKMLPHTLKGKDATAKAQTGTGKSASFIITIIAAFLANPVKNRRHYPRALILAPTRELVHQIEKDFKALAKYTNLRIVSVFGGTAYNRQQNMLKEKPVDVIAATPGRFIDFMEKGLINPSQVEIVVIDEADRMLDMGFIPDVRRIIYKTPHKNKRQTLFFSATLTDDVLRLAESWSAKNAVRIEIDPEQTASCNIRQIVYISTEKDKFKHVYNLIMTENLTRALLFVNRKDTARRLAEKFTALKVKCGVLSGDVSQDKRFRVLENFKKGRINILVATDVAARGIHIKNISHVINFDLPYEPEHYIHRIGRTGRAGASGISISFADETSSFFIPEIEKVLGYRIHCEYPSQALEAELPAFTIKKRQSKPVYRKKKNFRAKKNFNPKSGKSRSEKRRPSPSKS